MATRQQNIEFAKDAIPHDLLDQAIEFIKLNLTPDDVFSEAQLIEWAESAGYRLKGDDE